MTYSLGSQNHFADKLKFVKSIYVMGVRISNFSLLEYFEIQLK